MTEPAELRALFVRAAELAAAYRSTLGERPVGAVEPDLAQLRKSLGELGDAPVAPLDVLEELAGALEPGTVATPDRGTSASSSAARSMPRPRPTC